MDINNCARVYYYIVIVVADVVIIACRQYATRYNNNDTNVIISAATATEGLQQHKSRRDSKSFFSPFVCYFVPRGGEDRKRTRKKRTAGESLKRACTLYICGEEVAEAEEAPSG